MTEEDNKRVDRILHDQATAEDFKLGILAEEELKTKLSKEERFKLLDNEIEFNRELQVFVLNQMNKRALTTNYIVGTLNKLAWGILNNDFAIQAKLMRDYSKGGR